MAFSRRKLFSQAASVGTGLALAGTLDFRQHVLAADDSANSVDKPKRLIVVFSPHGTILRRWRPRALVGTYHPTEFSLDYQGSILAPLQAYKDKLLILDGVDYRVLYDQNATGHEGGMITALTGSTSDGRRPTEGSCEHGSIDQYIARQCFSDRPLPSLELAVGSAGGTDVANTLNYGPGGIALPSMNDPKQVFARLLAIKQQALQADSQHYQQSLLLQFIQDDLQKLRQKAGNKGKEILDIHQQSLSEIARSLENSQGISPLCDLGQQPMDIQLESAASIPQLTKQQIDLMVQSMYCGMTSVGSLRLLHAGAGTPMPFIDLNVDIHNDVAHAIPGREDLSMTDLTSAEEKMVQVQSFYSQQMAYLLKSLSERPEGQGSMLDHTMILWVNELGNAAMHGNLNVPMLLMGNCGSQIRMGRWLQLSQDQEPDCTYFFAKDKCPGEAPTARQTAHNHVLVSILRAFGLNNQSFGHPDYQGVLSELFS